MMKSCIFALCAIWFGSSLGCSDSSSSPDLGRACPVINGVFGDAGDEVTLQTKVEDDKYLYSLGVGLFLEADGPAFGIEQNSLRVACGHNSVTLYTKQYGREDEVTFTKLGETQIQVSSGGSSKVLTKTKDIAMESETF